MGRSGSQTGKDEPVSFKAFLSVSGAALGIAIAVLTLLGTYVFQTQPEARAVEKRLNEDIHAVKTSSAIQDTKLERIETSIDALKKESGETQNAMRRIYRQQRISDRNIERIMRKLSVRPAQSVGDEDDLFSEP